MRIPMGNFGFKGPDKVQHGSADVRLSGAGIAAVDAATQRLANTGMQIAGDVLLEERRKQEEDDRSRASVAVIGHQSAVQDAVDSLKERLSTGELSREKAQEAFTGAMTKVREQTMGEVPHWLREQAGVRLQGSEQRAMLGLNRFVDGLRRDELAGNLEVIRDTMAKDAGRPGAMPAV